ILHRAGESRVEIIPPHLQDHPSHKDQTVTGERSDSGARKAERAARLAADVKGTVSIDLNLRSTGFELSRKVDGTSQTSIGAAISDERSIIIPGVATKTDAAAVGIWRSTAINSKVSVPGARVVREEIYGTAEGVSTGAAIDCEVAVTGCGVA